MPPLAALRAFEATARLGSVTAAARELGVTQGAVSRQVMALEQSLGVALFERRNRRMAPTEPGAELASVATSAFQLLADGVGRLRSQAGMTTLHATTTFAPRWLLPRLGRFLAARPRFEVRLEIGGRVEEQLGDPNAAVIGYTRDDRLPAAALPLLADRSAPICAPSYRAAAPLLPGRLAEHRLLIATPDAWDWRHWASEAGADLGDLSTAIRLENDEAAIQAALAGAGLAMVTLELVAGELAEGRLLRPADLPSVLFGTYYLRPPLRQPAARRFKPLTDWLLS